MKRTLPTQKLLCIVSVRGTTDLARLVSASVEIVLDQPPRIRVSSGFDAELLREVVGMLKSR